jgi:hypothetical protein
MSLNNLPATPTGGSPTGGTFSITWFNQQWSILAQCINAIVAQVNTLTTQVTALMSAPTTPSSPAPTQVTWTQVDQTASRTAGTVYQNTSGNLMFIQGSWSSPGGSSVGTVTYANGSVNPPTNTWGNEATATVSGAPVGFAMSVPNGWFYSISISGDVSTPDTWFETTASST